MLLETLIRFLSPLKASTPGAENQFKLQTTDLVNINPHFGHISPPEEWKPPL